MNRLITGLILVQFIFVSAFAQSGNVFAKDQETYGNWSAKKFLEQGWSGYHVVSKVIKENNWVAYSCGDNCTRWHGPFCPDGDCKYTEKTTFFRQGTNGFEEMTAAPQSIIGTADAFDNGSIERTELRNVSNLNILRIDEVEAQSRLRFKDSQVSTLMGFSKDGIAHELGHIEESDAPNMVNQTESYYKLEEGTEKFITTVIERILFDDEGKENFRLGTIWCDSDEFTTRNIFMRGLTKFLFDSKFDFSKCTDPKKPLHTNMTSSVKQIFMGRGNADVSVASPDRKSRIKYEARTDVSLLGNGTSYFIRKSDGKDLVGIGSDKLTSMGNEPSDPNYAVANFPKVKMVAMDFTGRGSAPELDDAEKILKNRGQAVALLVNEKTGELKTRVNGHVCARESWGAYKDADMKNVDVETASVTCRRAKTYVLHYYILFPPEINGQKLSTYYKMQLLDAVLAAMPDQTQTSPELNSAEQFGDEIRLIEKVNLSGDPSVLTFEDLVDINTEEDSVLAQEKVWNLFAFAGLAKATNGGLFKKPVKGSVTNDNQNKEVKNETY